MEADDLLCSRNARPQKALVGRAQWKINQLPSLKRERASLEGSSLPSLDGRSGINTGAIPREVKQASLEGRDGQSGQQRDVHGRAMNSMH